MTQAISFEKVSKSYKGELFHKPHQVVKDFSFSVEAGHTLGLIGANGAGKSTCIKLLMGFIKADSGTIKLFDSSPDEIQNKRKIGYLPETTRFPPSLTVMDMLLFTATTCGVPKKIFLEDSKKILSDVNLWEVRNKQLRKYSKGMQQRASFAVALISNPDILILDEPMSGLDPLGRKSIISLIERLKDENKTILFCSHILEDVDRLADKLLVLHKGEQRFLGSPEELMKNTSEDSLADAYVTLVGELNNE